MSRAATPFDIFLIEMTSSFRRIAFATKNEFTARDLHSDAWLIGEKIAAKRGTPIDYSSPEERDMIIRRLYNHAMRGCDWKLYRAVRIDDDSSDAVSWSERLPAAAASDPLIELLRREHGKDDEERLVASYSQATAYVRTFENFGYDRDKVCRHLAMSIDVLGNRIRFAVLTVAAQHSLFDGKARIGKRFRPRPGRQCVPKAVDIRPHAQQPMLF
ncbi:MAG: hypothetical protein M3Y65_10525 [Pseudomonadota bacterium]|nr:hypothetical protein [Pseudomonadota bacterium]